MQSVPVPVTATPDGFQGRSIIATVRAWATIEMVSTSAAYDKGRST